MSDLTKRALEQSLKNLLLQKPLHKITISDIADDCGINRMTFYYHFKDIYDLVEWSCQEDAAKALFAGGSDDSNMPTTEITEDQLTDGKIAVLDLMLACGLIPSKGEGRRLVQQGGVMVNDEKVANIDVSFTGEQLKEGLKIRKGKKVFHKAILK